MNEDKINQAFDKAYVDWKADANQQLKTAEDEEFNRIEMESRITQEYVRDMISKPDIQKIMEELAWARMVIRELGDRLAKLEGK